MNVKQAAKIIGCNPTTLAQWCRKGKMPHGFAKLTKSDNSRTMAYTFKKSHVDWMAAKYKSRKSKPVEKTTVKQPPPKVIDIAIFKGTHWLIPSSREPGKVYEWKPSPNTLS